jgi:hypothetical protein
MVHTMRARDEVAATGGRGHAGGCQRTRDIPPGGDRPYSFYGAVHGKPVDLSEFN